MKITDAWLTDPPLKAVFAAFEAAGFRILMVGGCVRDAILREPVGDIDLSTDAPPDQMIALAKEAGLKSIPTGLDHGTVTIVCDGVPFEITTFRTDVETFGRHARVVFTDDIAQDARRRDFTMNALYAGSDGTVVDPLGGLPDVLARRVRFIEDPDLRIREDYLRILRFFRFNARYGSQQNGLDADGLDAIARNLDGLGGLARERIGQEVLKLLGASSPAIAVAAMRQSGVLAQVLPGGDDTALGPLIHLEEQFGLESNAIRRLCALGGQEVADHLRLSKTQTKTLALLTSEIGTMTGAGELGYRLGAEIALDVLLLRSAVLQMPMAQDAIPKIHVGQSAKFPVSAADLMPALAGSALGAKLKELEQRWIASEFTLSKEELL